MASNYPGSLDSFDTIASDKKTSDAVGGRTHRQMHNDLGDAIEAIEAELGTDPSGGSATVKARLDAIGTVGTGSPEGVVTAAPGSTWLQTDATTDVKGWLRWIKATGTGNTGWVVGPEADTGWRNLTGVTMQNGWTIQYGQHYIRRTGNVVDYYALVNNTSATADTFYTVPYGFRPVGIARETVWSQDAAKFWRFEIPSSGEAQIVSYNTHAAGTFAYLQTTWSTNDPWPSSLPGTAA